MSGPISIAYSTLRAQVDLHLALTHCSMSWGVLGLALLLCGCHGDVLACGSRCLFDRQPHTDARLRRPTRWPRRLAAPQATGGGFSAHKDFFGDSVCEVRQRFLAPYATNFWASFAGYTKIFHETFGYTKNF